MHKDRILNEIDSQTARRCALSRSLFLASNSIFSNIKSYLPYKELGQNSWGFQFQLPKLKKQLQIRKLLTSLKKAVWHVMSNLFLLKVHVVSNLVTAITCFCNI